MSAPLPQGHSARRVRDRLQRRPRAPRTPASDMKFCVERRAPLAQRAQPSNRPPRRHGQCSVRIASAQSALSAALSCSVRSSPLLSVNVQSASRIASAHSASALSVRRGPGSSARAAVSAAETRERTCASGGVSLSPWCGPGSSLRSFTTTITTTTITTTTTTDL